MYCGGHILASTALAMASSKRLQIDFVKLTSLMIATNLIDFDHLRYFYLDDGTANSLVLHSLHIYSGVLFFLIFLGGLAFRKFQNWSFALSGGFALHLAGDAVAYWFDYSIIILGFFDVALLILIAIMAKKSLPGIPFWNFMAFFIAAEIISTGTQVYLSFVLKLVPEENIIVYVVSPVLFLITAVAFWMIFKKYSQPVFSDQRN